MLKIEVISVEVVRSFDCGYTNKFRLRLTDFSDNEVILEGHEIEDYEIEEMEDPFKCMVNSLLRLYMQSRFGVS